MPGPSSSQPSGGHSHRAGSLHQANKKNKRAKASKRQLGRAAGGRVMTIKGTSRMVAASLLAHSREERRNRQQQKRQAQRQELIRKKRGATAASAALAPPTPRVVGILSLGPSQDIEDHVQNFILSGADHIVRPQRTNQQATVTCKFDVHKRNGYLTLLTGKSSFAHYGQGDDAAVLAALDLARVCDLILIVIDSAGARIEAGTTEIQIDPNNEEEPSQSSVAQQTSNSPQDWDHLISQRGERILTSLKAQGLPTPVTVLARTDVEAAGTDHEGNNDDDDDEDDDHMTFRSVKSLRRSRIKQQLDLKKYVHRFATTEFGSENNKVVEIDLSSTIQSVMGTDRLDDMVTTQKSIPGTSPAAVAFVRTLCTTSCSPPKWVSQSLRSIIISDTHEYNEETQELAVTGYIRGAVPFNVNALVHVPTLGTYVCKSVSKATPPLVLSQRRRKRSDGARTADTADSNERDVLYSNPERRESLTMFAAPNALEGEQNLIGFDPDDDEMHTLDEQGEDDDQEPKGNPKLSRPTGWSDYQSAWLDAIDRHESCGPDETDHGELAAELNKKSTGEESDATANYMELEDTTERNSVGEHPALLDQRRKERSEHQAFPDEVQVDEEGSARERFARYRSLKSFRKSQWDPKENLPDSYASIYHISSFKATQRSVMNDLKEIQRAAEAAKGDFWGSSPSNHVVSDENMNDDDSVDDEDILEGYVPSGSYVTLVLQDVAAVDVQGSSAGALLTVVSLLPHENKVSVLHMGLTQWSSHLSSTDVPIKSKDTLTFRCGWRTWQARPVFSQNNLNCDKHKFERFLPPGGAYFSASVFGPVTYTPCPVLMFRQGLDHTELVALGSMIGADADRIVVKRIVLTGYPVRVHKRYATVKYMFYNPEDVKWFRPAGLYSKHGLQGNILESVGEHGTMKCLFNAPIKQHDTVCLPLYKRIFPKYAPAAEEQDGMTTSASDPILKIR